MTLPVSDSAFNEIVTDEDSDENYYTRHYEHWDWPQGASGPTCGIGYDCGYVTVAEARSDWTGFIDDLMVQRLLSGCGLKGRSAQIFVNNHHNDITITWDQATRQFRNRELPKWADRVDADLPNCDKLTPTSFGALVSLAYNRGASFDLPGPRYAEMRQIKRLMTQQRFQEIPGEILAMRRLWPDVPGLQARRGREAALFQHGLAPVMT